MDFLGDAAHLAHLIEEWSYEGTGCAWVIKTTEALQSALRSAYREGFSAGEREAVRHMESR